jgi:hypothetical protein
MSSSVDVILKDKVVCFDRVPLVVVPVSIEKVATLEVRIKDKGSVVVIIFGLKTSNTFVPYLREVVSSTSIVQVDPCYIHEDIGEIVLFERRLKPAIVQLLIVVQIPQGIPAFLLILMINIFYLFLHLAVLKEGVLDGQQSVANKFGSVVKFGHEVLVGLL